MWTIGPQCHSLLRLYRFKDRDLEEAYQEQCNAACLHFVRLHAAAMAVIPVVSLAGYAGGRITAGFWLYAAVTCIALAFALVVRFCAASKDYIVPIHALFCCVVVAIFGALVSVQHTVWLRGARTLEPQGLSTELRHLDLYVQQLLASHTLHRSMFWIASQWIALAFTGMKPWSVAAYFATLVIFCACVYTCPSATAFGVAIITMMGVGSWMAIGVLTLSVENLRRSNFLAQATPWLAGSLGGHRHGVAPTQLARELHSSRLADSILNHTLKNILADVASNLEVFLSGAAEPALLEDCIACLRRGMQSCKDRHTYLKLATGEYHPVLNPVSLSGLAHQLAAGRPITVRAPDTVVPLDTTLLSLILENAISNAFHHGNPENADVQFTVSEFLSSAGEAGPGQTRHVRFAVSNAAHPQRPPPTPEAVRALFSRQPLPKSQGAGGLSFRIGLSHCVLAAKRGGIHLALMQEGDRVVFTASLDVPLDREEALVEANSPLLPAVQFAAPQGLCFCCIDDSVAAQRLLTLHIQRAFPAATVHCFGASDPDIERFLSLALAEANVVILDQHLDSESAGTHYGTDLVQQLLAAGYSGLACIRSANDSPEDRARYTASGAHCTVGKDVSGARMVEQLAAAYTAFCHPSLGNSCETLLLAL
eukprot:EG_transcript_3794